MRSGYSFLYLLSKDLNDFSRAGLAQCLHLNAADVITTTRILNALITYPRNSNTNTLGAISVKAHISSTISPTSIIIRKNMI